MSPLEEVMDHMEPALKPYSLLPTPYPGNWPSYVLEAVYEGYLLHYEKPRALAIPDEDLRLLGGDALYAQGLARLADEGRLEAVAELADLITGCARAQAEGRPADIEPLWEQSAVRLSK